MVDIKDIQSQIEKKYGEGLSFVAGSVETLRIDAISTGSLKLDIALGIGGVPRGRIVEIYGPESSGKTTLCQHIVAEAQQLNLQCAFVDVEHALDLEYAKTCGVDLGSLLVSQPDSGEQAMDIVEIYVRNGVNVIIVDSVAALVPRAEIEGEMGDAHMALQARLMSQALRKLKGIVQDNNCTLIFTNQLRMKVGIVFGNPETTPGGMALRFYASVRIDLRKRAPIKEGDEAIGNIARAKIVKNKVAPPFRECELQIRYNVGIDKADEIAYFVGEGLVPTIRVKGSNYYIPQDDGEEIRVNGRKQLTNKFIAEPEFRSIVENIVREALRLPMVEEV